MANTPETVEAILSWGSIMKFAFTTGLFTAALNQSFGWVKETLQLREKDRRAGKALALKLVEVLTNYAQECNS